ncbi:hypothetical protein AFE_2030 [Acidithiobacillus ferrooxidans ATCC 23270]|uniref:Uncharacterized protein n=1 Tax=Acidithiobacillus ferrooxidans (strain ATCC 23270 / DSM 14882 / CIP 104768 / NCIMB 8455) TaxID=243159 RepID=B7J4P1_ACIF2|nr:hypothetical protein AFE_2030 [Acidithiobacillus ferrooxidans ATCC 23270]
MGSPVAHAPRPPYDLFPFIDHHDVMINNYEYG